LSTNRFKTTTPHSSDVAATLVGAMSFRGFRADEVYPADINGDGRTEYLFLQSPGIFQEDVFDDTRWKTPQEEKDIYCLTATDGTGNVLWQFGTPWLTSLRYASHVADQMVWCGDLSGRGRPEVVALRRDRLYVLDGATGEVLRSRQLDADNYAIVRPIRRRRGVRLLIKNTERHYGDHWYGDPAHILDADLNLVATMKRSVGSGHSPRALDIDGDGDDEVLIGYEAYDADGRRLWRLEGEGGEGYDPMVHHLDQMQAGPLGPGGEARIVYAGSLYVMMGTLDGRLVWKRPFGHPQHVAVGRFRSGDRPASIAIFSCRVGEAQGRFAEAQGVDLPPDGRLNIAYLDRDGEVVSLAFPRTAWPARPDRGGPTHSGEGVLIYPQGCPDGGDALITRDWGWPQALDADGRAAFEFPFPGRQARGAEDDPVGPDGYGVRVSDVDGDGRAEALIHDRTTAWIFRPPLPVDGAPNTHGKLQPVTGQGWYAL